MVENAEESLESRRSFYDGSTEIEFSHFDDDVFVSLTLALDI
jgi:hypothetical protein